MTDEELIMAFKDGDENAFKELVKQYEPRVASTVMGMLGNCPEAEDVGQETFVRFYKNLKNFRGDASIGTYLTRIAINLSLNELKRRKGRSLLFFQKTEEEMFNIPDENFVLERIIEPNPEQKEKIDEILKKYDDKFADARFSIMKGTRTLMDSLHKELKPILTDEQKERLKEHSERFMMRDWRRPPFRMPFDRERERLPDIDFRKRRPFE